MAFSSPYSPPCPSPSTSSEHLSSTSSSSLQTPLTPISMARPPSTEPQQSSPPNRLAIDLPRSQPASKGGCWTCRIRRKKCDEQRQGNSCHTCIRLKIDCLGWGSKRPDWMRDKQAVADYKARIKAQLTRAGLIHGLPRRQITVMHTPPTPPSTVPRPSRSPRKQYAPTLPVPGSSILPPSQFELDPSRVRFYDYIDPGINPDGPASSMHNIITSERTSGSNPGFQRPQMPTFTDPDINNLHSPIFPYPPSSTVPINNLNDRFHYFSQAETQKPHTAPTNPHQFLLDMPVPSPGHGFVPVGQSTLQGEYVVYYFEHVRRLQYIFAGHAITNVTYSMILQDPHGAVTNAVCALAALHSKRMRIAQGLETPDANPNNSIPKFFYDEAYYQLIHANQRGCYSENDAIAALHLVTYSLFSGGIADWRGVLAVALDWLGQTGLSGDENPRTALLNMSVAGRCALKITMWLDIFSSLTLMRPPQFLALYRRLLATGSGGRGSGSYWAGSDLRDDSVDLRMESLSGCPDDVMLAIAEVSALAHWKDAEVRNRSLSVRELVRRGDEIEKRLRQHSVDPASYTEVDQVPLHPSLTPTHVSDAGHAVLTFPDEKLRRLAANIFREAALLYLHTVLSDNYPGVPETSDSVGKIIELFEQSSPSEVDGSLVFPICLAGCMTDDPVRREMLKARLQVQDQTVGNLMLTCAAMEAVWQKRDSQGGVVDWRETMRGPHLNLLLV